MQTPVSKMTYLGDQWMKLLNVSECRNFFLLLKEYLDIVHKMWNPLFRVKLIPNNGTNTQTRVLRVTCKSPPKRVFAFLEFTKPVLTFFIDPWYHVGKSFHAVQLLRVTTYRQVFFLRFSLWKFVMFVYFVVLKKVISSISTKSMFYHRELPQAANIISSRQLSATIGNIQVVLFENKVFRIN